VAADATSIRSRPGNISGSRPKLARSSFDIGVRAHNFLNITFVKVELIVAGFGEKIKSDLSFVTADAVHGKIKAEHLPVCFV